MKSAIIRLTLLLVFTAAIIFIADSIKHKSFTNPKSTSGDELKDNINDILVKDIENNEIQLSSFNGNVLLIVNVASECGSTPQYKGLEEIYRNYKDKGFELLAFPCNDFGGQEPGTNEEIKNFCTSNYNVTFSLFDKVKIKGEGKSALYKRLTNNSVTGSAEVKWNFEKFLISKEGKIISRFPTKTEPTSKEIISAIDHAIENN